MDIKPNIKNNFGPFTPRGFNKLAARANESKLFETSKNFDKLPPLFIAQITGSIALSATRWVYRWESGNLNSSGLFEPKTESVNYTKTNVYAYNTCEALQQSSDTKLGPGFLKANLSYGYTLQPIATGTYVHMCMSRGSDSIINFTFPLANAIDGTCS